MIESVDQQAEAGKGSALQKEAGFPARCSDDITIVPIRLSRLVDVKVEHPDPKEAAEIANTLVKTFMDHNSTGRSELFLDVGQPSHRLKRR